MNEFVKFECACDTGYDKGAIKKTIENNIFTIFGNLNQKNSIVIRYHGLLTENDTNDSTEFNMFYFFDNSENDKKIIKLQKCTKCGGTCYCATLELNTNNTLHFGFFDNNDNYELNDKIAFKLLIKPDPITNIMERYGFEHSPNLPVCEETSSKSFTLQKIFSGIKAFFSNFFNKQASI